MGVGMNIMGEVQNALSGPTDWMPHCLLFLGNTFTFEVKTTGK